MCGYSLWAQSTLEAIDSFSKTTVGRLWGRFFTNKAKTNRANIGKRMGFAIGVALTALKHALLSLRVTCAYLQHVLQETIALCAQSSPIQVLGKHR